jgi:hypothetical protein
MNKETEELQKAINLGQQAVEILSKSHVKEYTRTTASGASVQVKEHDDSRQAHQATKTAKTLSKEADTAGTKESHIAAAEAHDKAFHEHRQARENHTGEDVAAKHKGEKTAHDLDHGSSIHLLAMEQHQRASAAHSAYHNSVYGTPEADEANSKAEGHQSAVRDHGKAVQHFSGIAIKASDHAYNIGKAADKSKNPGDHKEAAEAHRNAAKLDWDSESRAEHEAKAAEHDKKAEKTYQTATAARVQAENKEASDSASNKAENESKLANTTGNHFHHYVAEHAHRYAASIAKDKTTKEYHRQKADEHMEKGDAARDESDGTK